ncbi:MAG: phosphoglucosamine mutase [Gemmatimonadetes bacterium]|nr:phosphoglucosamine mutase [Gemmatimonadota bacterium]
MGFEVPADLMVGVSGVRGRVGAGLTPEVVARIASAFGADRREAANGTPRIVVARDARTSGPMFERVVIAALQSTGCDVIAAGLVPTPTALLAVRHHGADGAIVVTASHNPVEWNALKFASGEGMFLDAAQGARMRAWLGDREIPRAGWDALGEIEADPDAVARHIDAILAIAFLDRRRLRERRFRVVLDCVRGAGAVLLTPLLEALGCEVSTIHAEPDGRFPREPEPVPENLAELEAKVRESAADIGLATDPDGDRLSIVSNRGQAIGEDLTLALAAELVLKHRKGPVVTNLSTSRVLADVAEAAGVPFERAPVGEIHVARAMQKAGAVIGGEGNGGVILPEIQLTRDAGVAAALVIQALLEAGQPLDRHLAGYNRYTIVKDKLPRGESPVDAAFRRLENHFGAPGVDRRDGLRLDWPDERRWLHLRASGTEPILRIIAEAPTQGEARELVSIAREALAAGRG